MRKRRAGCSIRGRGDGNTTWNPLRVVFDAGQFSDWRGQCASKGAAHASGRYARGSSLVF